MSVQTIDRHIRVAGPKYLYSPIVDFLLLGGSALLILPVLMLVPTRFEGAVAATTLALAHVVNHPHFAHSYQIFYRNFGRKIRGDGYARGLQVRYVFAGIVVPIIMLSFFAYGVIASDAWLLGYAANAMTFFVGWHYVKQGYGMAMVDAVLKKLFFKEIDKKIMLINGYAVWVLSWMQANTVIFSHNYWGLRYYTFAVPDWAIDIGAALAAATTIATTLMLINRWRRNGGALPYNGIVAYLVSLYAWILFVKINPMWLLVVPALHSLQYLAVVWRYQSNVEQEASGAADQPQLSVLAKFGPMWRLRVILFILVGGILGFAGFWGLPLIMNTLVPYNQELLGSALFLFVAWIFINIHHFFLDNVMWRRGNPDVAKHLFR